MGHEMRYGAEIVGVGLLAFIALIGAALGVDEPFRQHMWVLFFTVVIFGVLLMRNTSFAPAKPIDQSLYMDGPIRYGTIATLFWAIVGLLVGVIVALQLTFPDFNIEPWFNFG